MENKNKKIRHGHKKWEAYIETKPAWFQELMYMSVKEWNCY